MADIHFHYKRAIGSGAERCRLPAHQSGNIGNAQRVRDVVQAAKDHGCSMRIGVNAGSLEPDLLEKYGEPCPEAMVESALNHARILEDNDFREYKISVKASDAFLAVAAYQQLSEAVDCPIHLGITEAGGMISGTVKSSIGMGMLLWSGIGDTIRVSLSADPVEEVRVGFDILKSLNLRHRGVNIVSCPSCARQGFNVIETVGILEQRLKHIATPMTLSIIGCVVNGPGEARETDLGFTGGGAGKGAGMIYLNGRARLQAREREAHRPRRRALREESRDHRSRARQSSRTRAVAMHPHVTMAGLDPATPARPRQRTEKTFFSLADARSLGGRVKPGHGDLR